MISQVKIKNFKSIKDQTIELGKVTTFIGKSEQGKSNLIRALAQLSYNGGCNLEDTVTHGECGFRISEILDDGLGNKFEITAERTLKKQRGLKFTDGFEPDWNRYTVKNLALPGEPLVLDKVGVYVPDRVKEILKMDEIQLDEDLKLALNYRDQLPSNGIFILSLSTSKKSTFIGKISPAINSLNVALKNSITDARSSKTVLENRYEPDRINLKVEIEVLNKKMDVETGKFNVLSKLREVLFSLSSSISEIKSYLSLKDELSKLENSLSSKSKAVLLITKLESVLDILSATKSFFDLKESFRKVSQNLKNAVLLEKLVSKIFSDSESLVYCKSFSDAASSFKSCVSRLNYVKFFSSALDKCISQIDDSSKILDVLNEYKLKTLS